MESNSTQEEQKLEVKERTQNIHPLSSPKKHRNNNTNNNNTNNNNNKSPRKSQNSLNRGKKLKRKDSILYSQDEHEELEKIFNEVDRHGDGFLLKEQLPDVYERIFGSFPTDKQLSQMEENYILIQEKIYLKEFKKGTVHWLLEKEKEEFEAVTGSEDRTLRFQKTEIQILRQVILQLKQKLGQIEMEREGMNEDLQDQATELRNLREDLKKVQKEKEKQIRVLQRNLETVENDLHEYDKGNMPPASPTKYKTFYHDSRKDDENYILHLENTVRDLKKENQLLRITARVNLNRSNNQSFGDQDPEDKDEKIRVLTEKVQELGESLNESKILSEAKERKIKELSQKIDELELLLAQSKQIDTNQSLNDELSFFAMFATNHQMPDIPKTPPPSPHLSPVQSPRTPRVTKMRAIIRHVPFLCVLWQVNDIGEDED